MKRMGRVVLIGLLGLVFACLAAVGLSALSNRNLPTQSAVVERLSQAEKARLEEMFHLRQALGDSVWPGWGEADIPVITYNEDYAFLVGYPDPPAGWVRMPQEERRGTAWVQVPGDTWQGQPYYRQPLPDPEVTPENFTVLVGDRWVATLQTKEYAEIAFVAGFRRQLPPLVRDIFPYRVVWHFLGGDTTVHIGALEHEAFHAYQGAVAYPRLAEAERVAPLEERYPWDDEAAEADWQTELDLLHSAATADSAQEAAELARQFLRAREDRRANHGLAPELIGFERQREWLEGLAKYAELSIVHLAGAEEGYEPLPDMAADPTFDNYAGSSRYWSSQLGEIARMTGRSGDVRFYYSGFAQALLLDRLKPGWKDQTMQSGVFLEDLLREAVAR